MALRVEAAARRQAAISRARRRQANRSIARPMVLRRRRSRRIIYQATTRPPSRLNRSLFGREGSASTNGSRSDVPEMTEDSSPSSDDHRVVQAYLFDRRQGESVDDWAESLRRLDKDQVLRLDLQDASHEQAAEVLDALDLGDAGELRLGDPEKNPAIVGTRRTKRCPDEQRSPPSERPDVWRRATLGSGAGTSTPREDET